ncbi:MAG: Dps family protein [Hyphomicrobiaceae bacterium]
MAKLSAVRTTPEAVKTGLADKVRAETAKSLATVLGDTYLLMVKSHVYHWNVVGPQFLPLHELLEIHYRDLFQAADIIAERIRGLGHVAPLSFEALEKTTDIAEETRRRGAGEMVEQLVTDHEQIARTIRDITAKAADVEDFVTHDILNARLAFHEKAIWMLRAMQA